MPPDETQDIRNARLAYEAQREHAHYLTRKWNQRRGVRLPGTRAEERRRANCDGSTRYRIRAAHKAADALRAVWVAAMLAAGQRPYDPLELDD